MNKSNVFELLEQHQNQRGIEHWQNMANTQGLTSYGMGLTIHRKLAKKIGRNHELALELWNTNNYDAKVIGLLIDEPKKLTKAQIEQQVEDLGIGLLTHVFSSCDATLPRADFAFELAQEWLNHPDPIRRQCAYGLIYEFTKKNNKHITQDFYLDIISKIEKELFDEPKRLRVSMGAALMGIGKRNIELNQRALEVARKLGPIDFNESDKKCDPMNIEKHLTSDYLMAKLGLN